MLEEHKILIVDDDILFRRLISEALKNSGKEISVTKASDAMQAFSFIEKNTFDLIILDYNMPVMDGLQALEKIKNIDNQIEVVMLSSSVNEDLKVLAIDKGAKDILQKPSNNSSSDNFNELRDYFMNMLKFIPIREPIVKSNDNFEQEYFDLSPKRRVVHEKNEKEGQIKRNTFNEERLINSDLVVIAISTGGPKLLEEVLTIFEGQTIRKPLLIVQHMPEGFTAFFVESLNRKHGEMFVETSDGLQMSSKIYIAKGGKHTIIKKDPLTKKLVFALDDGPQVKGLKPAADVTFKSIAENANHIKLVTLVLTGLGDDGLEGIKMLKPLDNTYSFAQTKGSATAYGMPGAIVNNNLADVEIDIEYIKKVLDKAMID